MAKFSILAAAAAIGSVMALPSDLTVQTPVGSIRGHVFNGAAEFIGIPFAQPPVGNLRLANPVAPPAFTSTYDASFVAPQCPQDCDLPTGSCAAVTSEDCLYLNLWTPVDAGNAGKAPLPVFIWMYGGAFEMGTGNVPVYNGAPLATSQDIIVVNFNYRLGALGFYTASDMEGNWAVKDQQMAMKWVHDNIEAFGGDKTRVTIGGQSAGAMSVGVHLTAPSSWPYFSQAIMESNPWALPYKTKQQAADMAKDIAVELGCGTGGIFGKDGSNDLTCLRSKSVDQWLEAQSKGPKLDKDVWFNDFVMLGPVQTTGEDSFLPYQPFEALRTGKTKDVNTLTGTVTEDGIMFVDLLLSMEIGATAYESALNVLFGRSTAKLVEQYYPADMVVPEPGTVATTQMQQREELLKRTRAMLRGQAATIVASARAGGEDVDERDVLGVLATDLMFHCPARNATRGAMMNGKKAQTYVYKFSDVWSFPSGWEPSYPFCAGRVCHSSELPFVFDSFTPDYVNYYDITEGERALNQVMMSQWGNFIKTGNPSNAASAVQWPAWSKGDEQYMVLSGKSASAPVYLTSNLRDEYCNLWDQLGYLW